MMRFYAMYRALENAKPTSQIHQLCHNFDNCVRAATNHIRQGGVIAVPTDTIYGLAADAQNHEAVQKLYAIKGRDFLKPIAICVPSVSVIGIWGRADHIPRKMLSTLLPGPVTVILNRTERLNPSLNPKTVKVGIRIPKHDFMQHLTSSLNTPIALTSANKSNEMSSIAVHEFSSLWSQLDAVFDNGTIGNHRSGSTIVDLSEPGKYEIVRKGSYLEDTIRILKKFEFLEK